MVDPHGPMEYFQAAVDDGLRIGFTATCEQRDGKLYVTLSKDGQSETIYLPEDMLDADSDALREALALPLGQAYRAINLRLEAAKKPVRKKAKKRKKAKRARTQLPAKPAADSKAGTGTEGSNASPESTTEEPTHD